MQNPNEGSVTMLDVTYTPANVDVAAYLYERAHEELLDLTGAEFEPDTYEPRVPHMVQVLGEFLIGMGVSPSYHERAAEFFWFLRGGMPTEEAFDTVMSIDEEAQMDAVYDEWTQYDEYEPVFESMSDEANFFLTVC